jgi:phosphatidylglycerol:prolipoprotein diacylglycerol transferase
MLYWDPNPDLFTIPFLNLSIKWYGFFFALGFALCFPIFRGILSRFLAKPYHPLINRMIDQLTLYVVLGTIIGARLGHFLFYEHPREYLLQPLKLLWLREGGLASHGAALGILLALILFSQKVKKKFGIDLSWIRLLDLLVPCAALTAGFIRLGNFMNQEILGSPTSLPWAIVFGHPQDGTLPLPRHPVQLYEAFFYFFLFFFFWRASFRLKMLSTEGRFIGLFLIFCFSFRFLVEFIKLEQSRLVDAYALISMGQWLSLPFIALGFLFLKRSHRIV